MIFPRSENNILNLIYKNPEVKLSEIIKKAKVSAATAKKRLDYLLNFGIINENKIIGGGKVLIRNFYPNLASEEGKCVFSLIEAQKKQEFFEKNNNLIGPFKQLVRNMGEQIEIVLIFGSFARFAAEKDSDLDILFLSKKEISSGQLKKEIERSFVTFNKVVSPRFDTWDNFKRNMDQGIYQSIIKDHIIVKGILNYLSLIEKL